MTYVQTRLIPIKAVDQASGIFENIGMSAEKMITKISRIATLGATLAGLVFLIGGASREARALSTAMIAFSAVVQIVTTVLSILNIPLTFTVSLLTLGVGTAMAMTAALAMLATQASATSGSLRDLNAEARRTSEIETVYHQKPTSMERRGIER